MSEVDRTFAAYAELTEDLIGRGDALGLTMRTVGSVAIWQSLGTDLRRRFGEVRRSPHDVDLLAPSGSSDLIKKLFAAVGAEPDERLIAWHGKDRHRYFHDHSGPEPVEIDVFLGVPPLCHEIEFESRLDVPGPHMGVTDLFLQKAQVAEPDEKDLIDAAMLLLGHGASSSAEGYDGPIDAARVAGLLGRDWGFWHTATMNLEQIRARAIEFADPAESEALDAAIGVLRRAIDEADKTRKWKLRKRLGTKVPWYTPVEDLVR